MPRHVADDFSFLPTVDSTEEEIMEKQTLRRAVHQKSQPGEDVTEQQAHEEPPLISQPAHPAPVPQAADTAHVSASEAPKTPSEPEQDGRALWEAFEKEQLSPASTSDDEDPVQPEMNASQATTRAPDDARQLDEKARQTDGTPAVSLSKGRQKLKNIVPADPPPLRSDKPAVDEPAPPQANPKSFTAPKPKPENPEDPEAAKKTRWRKLAEKIGVSSLGLSVGVHLFLLLAAAFVGVSQVMERQVDFLPGGGSAQSQAAAENLAHKIQQKRNPWLKAKPRMQKITVQTIAADIVLPDMPPMDMMDFSSITNRMDISKAAAIGSGQPMGMGTAGAGGGFGAGIGRGGKFSFVGQTAFGRRVVFVVDVSGSMSAIGQGEKISRFELLKKELVKSISQIPPGTAYQILFFSDFAWPHNEVDSRNSSALEKYRWLIDSKDYKKVRIPPFKYIQASPFTLQDSRDIVERSENPGGTNWGSGLLMALNASPKPDLIFFMTDGLESDEQGWVDVVTTENKRRAPMTVIHTSAMQEPSAARALDQLAKRNNGKFTVVMGEGKVIKGDDYFKMK